MELTREEFEVLWNISEGATDTIQLPNLVDLALEQVKDILTKLETEGLITVRKTDTADKESVWDAEATEKAEPLFEKYKAWTPA